MQDGPRVRGVTAPVLPGAEPFSAPGGPHGALVLHGFTGSPQSMRGLAERLAAAGLAVELPLLPGHGTTVEDMMTTGWDDWSAAAELAYVELASRCTKVVVAGLSMGATITCWLAERHPEIAGIVCINPAVEPALPDVRSAIAAAGDAVLPAIGSDIADPDQTELAYGGMPAACLVSLFDGQEEVAPALGEIRCPVLLFTSRDDHVVAPTASELLVREVAGPVDHVWLERSFHVATLDYDREQINEAAAAFARRVTEG